MPRLNEVQFPEELQLVLIMRPQGLVPASMKCSSRRNCSTPRNVDCSELVRPQ